MLGAILDATIEDGHLTTNPVYSHVTPTMQKNAVEQFAGRLAGA
ncbi:MAG: hypothetical protein QM650_09535 [Microlunatus sp.]